MLITPFWVSFIGIYAYLGEYLAISTWLHGDFLSDSHLKLPLIHFKSIMTVFHTKGPIINYFVSLIFKIHKHLFVGLLGFLLGALYHYANTYY